MKLNKYEKQHLIAAATSISLMGILLIATLNRFSKLDDAGGLKAAVDRIWNGRPAPEATNSGAILSQTTNCTFIGRNVGINSTNIEGTVLLGNNLEATESWVFRARLKSGRIIQVEIPTNDPIDFMWQK